MTTSTITATTATTAATLGVQQISLRAGDRILLERFTHTFHAGEVWCITGPNGAGKTTLISVLAGLLSPAAGHVALDGTRLADWSPAALARRRALMPQTAHDAFSASVLDIVMLNRFPHLAGWGWEGEADRAAAHAALDLLGLAEFASRDVLSLSGGERQRVALAAVLCQEAPLLLLDEPLAHLDLHHQVDCLEALTEWARGPQRNVVFSCHDLNLARRFASHALLLDGTGAAYVGPVREVLTPELASRAFGYPLILLQDGGHEALIPAPRPPRATY
jgi:iron complex transport system ATP-binding protein